MPPRGPLPAHAAGWGRPHRTKFHARTRRPPPRRGRERAGAAGDMGRVCVKKKLVSCWLLDRDEPARARSPRGGCDGVHAIGSRGDVGEPQKRSGKRRGCCGAARATVSVREWYVRSGARASFFLAPATGRRARGEERNERNARGSGTARHGTARRARDPVVVTPELTPLAQTSPSASPPPDRPAPGPPFARFAERRIFPPLFRFFSLSRWAHHVPSPS